MDYTAEDFRFDLEVIRVCLGRGGTAPEGIDWVRSIIDGLTTGTVLWGGNRVTLGKSRKAQFLSAVSAFNLSSEDDWMMWMENTPLPMGVTLGSVVYVNTPAHEG